ncbi:MAG: hypothetical protein ACOC05_09985, partial [Oceanicaulis sp.]
TIASCPSARSAAAISRQSFSPCAAQAKLDDADFDAARALLAEALDRRAEARAAESALSLFEEAEFTGHAGITRGVRDTAQAALDRLRGG